MASKIFGKAALGAFAAAALALVSAPAAHATIYHLVGLTFDDGATATGVFSTNVSGYPAGHEVTTTIGILAGYHYTNDINVAYNPGDSAITFYHNDPSYDGFLTLATAGPIDSGLPEALLTGVGGPSFECSSYSCPGGVARYLVSGSLVASVPEPATWSLMIVGLGGVGYAMRRARKDPAFA